MGRFVVAEMRRLHDAALADQRAETLAWVLMPDHWHWLIRLSDPPDLSGIVNLAKGRAARAINQALNRSGPVWQSGYHDRAIRSADNLRDAARYIVANPLRAGLVQRIGDYPLWDCVWFLDGG